MSGVIQQVKDAPCAELWVEFVGGSFTCSSANLVHAELLRERTHADLCDSCIFIFKYP